MRLVAVEILYRSCGDAEVPAHVKLKPLDVTRETRPGKCADGDRLYLIVASATSFLGQARRKRSDHRSSGRNLRPVVLNDWDFRRSSNLESLRAYVIRVVVDRPGEGATEEDGRSSGRKDRPLASPARDDKGGEHAGY